jgi:hypothetical protein
MDFAIVEFKSDNTVAVVSSNWIALEDGLNYCYWPSFTSAQREKAIRENIVPDHRSWKAYEINFAKKFGKFSPFSFILLSKL